MTFTTRNNVSSLEDKRRERAGFGKLGVLETPDADLIAERDRVDEAWERFTLQRTPTTVEEARQAVARNVDEARAKLMAALKAADHPELSDLHPRVALVALEVDTLLSDLVERDGAA